MIRNCYVQEARRFKFFKDGATYIFDTLSGDVYVAKFIVKITH